MKIVGFEANNGARLGIVEGDNVVDLQAADAQFAGRFGRDLAPKQWRSEASRRLCQECSGRPRVGPLAGLKFALPVARPGKNHLSRAELSRSRQGRSATRQYPEISSRSFSAC